MARGICSVRTGEPKRFLFGSEDPELVQVASGLFLRLCEKVLGGIPNNDKDSLVTINGLFAFGRQYETWSEGARLTGIQAPGYMPEHMNGDRYLPGERSVPHQLFSSVGVVVPAVRGLLGLQTSEGAGTDSSNQRLIRFHPQLPANWSFLRFSGYLVGNARVSGEVRQEQGRTVVRLHSNGTHPVPVEVGAPIPLLAKARSVMVNGKAGHFLQKQLGGVNSVDVQLALERDAEVSVEYEGGVCIVPPCVKPAAGDRNASLKIMRVNAIDKTRWRWLSPGWLGAATCFI